MNEPTSHHSYLALTQKRRLALFVLTIPLASIATPQSPDGSVNLPVLGDCSDSDSGYLFGEAGLDAVMLFDQTPAVLKCPDAYRAPVVVNAQGYDLAVLTRPWGTRDHLYINTTTAGLGCFDWNGSFFADITPGTQDVEWSGARGIGFGEDGAGQQVAVAYNGSLLGLCDDASLIWTGTVWTDIGDTIREVKCIQWDGVAGDEVVVRTDSSVRVCQIDGVFLASYPVTGPSDVLTVTGIPGTNREGVVYFTGGDPGINLYMELRDTIKLHSSQDLGGAVVVGAHTSYSDTNQDGLWNESVLALSTSTGTGLSRYSGVMTGGNMSWAPGAQWLINGWPDVSGNIADPHFADFDNDGDDDLMFTPAYTLRTLFFSGNDVDESLQKPELNDIQMRVHNGTGHFYLQMKGPGSNPAGHTHLEYTLFQQPRGDYYLESQPLSPVRYVALSALPCWIPIDTGETEWFEQVLHVELHCVTLDANDDVLAQGPAATLAVALKHPLGLLRDQDLVSYTDGTHFEVPAAFEFDEEAPSPPPPAGVPNPAATGGWDYESLPPVQGEVLGGGSGDTDGNPDSDPNDPPEK